MTQQRIGRLEGKVAIIVGAGQSPGETIGNGRATAIRFAEEGATVLLVDRRLASAEETGVMISARCDGSWQAIEGDVTQAADCERYVQACVAAFGRLDILHNNVGIGGGDGGPSSVTEEAWDRIHDASGGVGNALPADLLPAIAHGPDGGAFTEPLR